MKKTNKKTIFLSIMLLVTAVTVRADDMIKNETGKHGGKPQKISVYTSHTKTWKELTPGEEAKFFVSSEGPRERAHIEIIVWDDGNKTYISNMIRKPKNTSIYDSGKYLTHDSASKPEELQAIEIKKENVVAAINKLEAAIAEEIKKAEQDPAAANDINDFWELVKGGISNAAAQILGPALCVIDLCKGKK